MSMEGTRRCPIVDFVQGPRRTILPTDALVSAILVPRPQHPTRSHFEKIGGRKYLLISTAMIAINLEYDKKRIHRARIAVGACGPVAKRLPRLEEMLVGRPRVSGLGNLVTATHLETLTPIDDVRASADYRIDAVVTLLRRALNRMGEQS